MKSKFLENCSITVVCEVRDLPHTAILRVDLQENGFNEIEFLRFALITVYREMWRG